MTSQTSPNILRSLRNGRRLTVEVSEASAKRVYRQINMKKSMRLGIVALCLATACLAQEGLTVRTEGKKRVSATEAEKIYLSACSVVQREFGGTRSVRPRVTLILGANRDAVWFDDREITLTKWDPRLFAQGVVVFAFEDLMPLDQRRVLASRAVNWADATVEIDKVGK